MIIKSTKENIGFLLTLQQELLLLLDEKEKNKYSSFYDTEKIKMLEQKKQEATEILFDIIKKATFQVDRSFIDIGGNKSDWSKKFIEFEVKNFSKRQCNEVEDILYNKI